MRKILLFISILLITSCEKIIDIDLNFSKENYVIDAKINKHVNLKSGFSEVLISKSRPYFEDNIAYINDAKVKIIELITNKEFSLNLMSDGLYKTEIDEVNEQSEYKLVIEHQSNKFSSIEERISTIFLRDFQFILLFFIK